MMHDDDEEDEEQEEDFYQEKFCWLNLLTMSKDQARLIISSQFSLSVAHFSFFLLPFCENLKCAWHRRQMISKLIQEKSGKRMLRLANFVNFSMMLVVE